jgi:hypothetical protein
MGEVRQASRQRVDGVSEIVAVGGVDLTILGV